MMCGEGLDTFTMTCRKMSISFTMTCGKGRDTLHYYVWEGDRVSL